VETRVVGAATERGSAGLFSESSGMTDLHHRCGREQSRRLRKPANEIRDLDRLAGGSFSEVVENGDDDETAAARVHARRDVAEVRSHDVLHGRKAQCRVDHADEVAPA
jgi:hypothetical protein